MNITCTIRTVAKQISQKCLFRQRIWRPKYFLLYCIYTLV